MNNNALFNAGLVDTAVKTAETGYMQRRLVKVAFYILIWYLNRVLHGFQTIYGEIEPFTDI